MWKTTVLMLLYFCAIAIAGHADDGSLAALARGGTFTTHRESSSHEELNRNGDARSIAPGETLVLGELEGPGEITHMWCTVGSYDMFYPRALVLRFYWDGSDTPAVEVPLGDFFAVGHGALANVTSAPVSVTSEGRARNCFWVMPFKKSAKVTVTNESSEIETDSFYYYLDWRKYKTLPEDSLYFHAQYRQATPATPGDYTILKTTGRGHYVGTVQSVHMMDTGWFGEGDDRFYIDGEATPSLRGTGTEDYYSDAWGFRQFCEPMYGVPLWEGYFIGDRVTAYRWHLDSPVAFTKSLKLTIEHKGSIFTDQARQLGSFVERPDWISTVAYWYADSPAGDNPAMAPLSERVPPYRVINPDTLNARATPKQLMMKDSGGVMYLPGKPDASIEFDFTVDEPGRYRIDAVMFYAFMGGVYQPFVDGTPIGGEIDFCREGQDPVWTRFDVHDLDAGTHTLRFEGHGMSPNARTLAPKSYGLGLARLVLLRLQDMAGYQEAQKAELNLKK